MFYYVNGTVAELEAGLAVIDCGGVGYACATTNYTLSQLKKGERAKLYTYLNVREDAMELFGFASQSELRSFKMLIGVSGVGPKAALAILAAAALVIGGGLSLLASSSPDGLEWSLFPVAGYQLAGLPMRLCFQKLYHLLI